MSEPLALVLDTNIILDCFVFTDPWVAPLLAAIDRGDAVMLTRADCLEEFKRVLDYPKLKLDPARQTEIYERYAAKARSVIVPANVGHIARLPRCADQDDQKFLELARDAQADYLVSKDKRVLQVGRRRAGPLPFRVVDPRGMLAALARPAAMAL